MLKDKKRPRVNVHVDADQYEEFKVYSKITGVTFTDLVNDALVQFNQMIGGMIQAKDKDSLMKYMNDRIEQTKNLLKDAEREVKDIMEDKKDWECLL